VVAEIWTHNFIAMHRKDAAETDPHFYLITERCTLLKKLETEPAKAPLPFNFVIQQTNTGNTGRSTTYILGL